MGNRPHSWLILAAVSALLTLPACATSVSADGGAGGIGGSTGGATTGGAGGATGGTGGVTTNTGPCTGADDCVAFTDSCNTGACINGECGKLPANDGSACEDGKECTQNDYCDNGVCIGGALKPCVASDPCMVGTCDPGTDQCVEVPGNNGAPCTLGDACVIQASCISGVCQPKQLKDCSFMNTVCGTGFCNPQNGACEVSPMADGSVCNDGKFCTVNDQCVGGQCKGLPNTCSVAAGDPCKVGVCNELNKTCQQVAGNDGAACDDGNLCTAGETCALGKCVNGAPANDGAACDDGDGCTGGTSCAGGTCQNATSQIVACVDGDMCCPAGCANDKDCLYWASGVQQDVPATELTGWTQCYVDNYANFNTSMSQILQQCDKGKLLLACRQVGQTVFKTLAMAPRADVLFDCGSQEDCTHPANGVGWYYSDSWSWGYAPEGEVVSRNSCDVNSQASPDRLCWHSGGGNINGGWRCGAATNLNGDVNWERVVFQAD
ncbi:MAG: hypothetical protein R3B70_09370 [Polyangiaceae bacterium]